MCTIHTVDEVFAEVRGALEGEKPAGRPTWLDIYDVPARVAYGSESPMLPELHQVLNLLEGGFTELKVLVVGDIMLDRYIHGEVERISPEAPVPVLRHAQRYDRAGGAANVAMNLAGLGCQTVLAGFWGDDAEKAELDVDTRQAGINTVGVVSSSLPTISKTRIIGRMQQLLRLDIESRDLPPAVEMQRLIERAVGLVEKVHAVILSDYAKGAVSATVVRGGDPCGAGGEDSGAGRS